MGKPTKEEQYRDGIMKDYQSGMLVKEIAAKYQVATTTVGRWLTEWKVEKRPMAGAPPLKRQKHWPRVLELHRTGKTIAEIGAEVEVHYSTVARWLREEGEVPNYGGAVAQRSETNRQREELRNQVLDLYRRGDSIADTARQVGVDRKTVNRWIDQAGIRSQGGEAVRNQQLAARAVDLYQQGIGILEVGRQIGRSYLVVRGYLDQAGVEVRDAGQQRSLARLERPMCEREGCDNRTPRLDVKYCSPDCRRAAAPVRQPNLENYRTRTCLNETCGEEFTRHKNYGKGDTKYCSNACAHRHTKTRRFYAVEDFDIVFESSYEAFFWGACKIAGIPIERFDRQHGINYDPARSEAWYAPDFWLPTLRLAVEIKGLEDDLDRVRWEQWPGRLAVFAKGELETASPTSVLQRLTGNYGIQIEPSPVPA